MSEQAHLAPQNKYLKDSWREIVDSGRKPRDARSAEEIAADVIAKCGLEVI